MNEQQPSQGSQEPAAAANAQPVPTQPLPPDRKAQAFCWGMLAGIGIAIGLAIVMHVIQQASSIGYGMNIDGSVFLVLLVVGPVIGLGLGMGLAAVVHEPTADVAVLHPAAPADRPPVPSA
jgi:hypothetical protein